MTMTEEKWVANVASKLVGKTIKSVEFMSTYEAKERGWCNRPLMIRLSDEHTLLTFSKDDEGNDGGSIFTTYKDLPTIPTLYHDFPKK